MLQSLPYELPELVTRAPLDTHRSTVIPEWVDWNGHMNVAFYVAAFDQASGAFMRNMGLGRRYVDGKLGMTFVLETHVTYDRELREGAPLHFATQLLARDAKKVHLFHEMYHAEQDYLAATNETIIMNIDYATRRSAPWPAPVAERLDVIWETHKALPKPAKSGRVMSLAKKT
ncbi:MAG: thioesterase family protein [Proteobacteria bacterium]|nr:thioesterase family protein [Pseudomonadota bacterium]